MTATSQLRPLAASARADSGALLKVRRRSARDGGGKFQQKVHNPDPIFYARICCFYVEVLRVTYS